MLALNTIHKGDCTSLMPQIGSGVVDAIVTDPPYLYLKNQKLDRPFDEQLFFAECKRVLKPNGFIVLFGRGTSFYRWNTRLADLGFTFKEEIVWDKGSGTSPLQKLIRVHETVSIFNKGNASINKVKIPYLEQKKGDLSKIQNDLQRIIHGLGNPQSLMHFKNFMSGKRSDMVVDAKFTKYKVTSDIRKSGARDVNVLASITNGITEKSIIYIYRDHYNSIHPTQKPVRLLERLLALVTREGDVVLDPFSGSGSTAIAATNMGRRFIGMEIDEEYYQKSETRVREAVCEAQSRLF
jgi:site-specific DNA-methyltransferase (adenine-specific)